MDVQGIAAQLVLAFHKVDVIALAGHLEGRRHARDTAAHHQPAVGHRQ